MSMQKVKEIAQTVVDKAAKAKKISIFSIANTANKNNASLLFPAVRETSSTIAGNVLVASAAQAKEIVRILDGVVDVILLDVETKVPGLKNTYMEIAGSVQKSKLLTFKPNDITVDAVDAFLAQRVAPLYRKKVAIIGAGNIGSKIALRLVEREVNVVMTKPDADSLEKIAIGLNCIKPKHVTAEIQWTTDNVKASCDADVLIGCTAGLPVINEEMVMKMKAGGILLDVGNGTLFPGALEVARKRDIQVFCLFMRPAYEGAVQTIFATEHLMNKMGCRSLGNFSIISGGVMGALGDVIVDDVTAPQRILAIANGCGDVISNIDDPRFSQNIERVKKELV